MTWKTVWNVIKARGKGRGKSFHHQACCAIYSDGKCVNNHENTVFYEVKVAKTGLRAAKEQEKKIGKHH